MSGRDAAGGGSRRPPHVWFWSALMVAVAVAGSAWAAGETAAAPVPNHGWWSVVPPVLAIGLALVTRQVLLALLLGVWVGAIIVTGHPGTAWLRLGDTYLLGAVADESHASILLFSTILGGMVGVLSRSGATEGIVHWLGGRVGGRRGGQVATAAMGTLIFFDDYANTLLVGSTMRPLTDRLRISREKLAWLVDSTAAPVATVAVISTWVGFEIGLIQDAMAKLGDGGHAYTFFLRTIPYSYYPLLTLVLVYMAAASGRDFGPMLRAERRAFRLGQVLRPGARPASDVPAPDTGPEPEDAPAHPALAGVPIAAVIGITAVGLCLDGRGKALAAGLTAPGIREFLNHADSFAVLTWAALGGATAAIVLAVVSRRLSLSEAFDGYIDGAKAMVIAVTILVLAWSLSGVCEVLGTADHLIDASRQVLSARLLPLLVFVLAAAVSFATGTSWGAMAILMPLVYPLAARLPLEAGLAASVAEHIHLSSVSAVLAGAVFGDHCSPISDTTILSSLATGSDHVDHVKTQLPYSLMVAGIAAACGYVPVGLGAPPFVSLILGVIVLVVFWVWLSRPVIEDEDGVAGEAGP